MDKDYIKTEAQKPSDHAAKMLNPIESMMLLVMVKTIQPHMAMATPETNREFVAVLTKSFS